MPLTTWAKEPRARRRTSGLAGRPRGRFLTRHNTATDFSSGCHLPSLTSCHCCSHLRARRVFSQTMAGVGMDGLERQIKQLQRELGGKGGLRAFVDMLDC